MLVDNFGNIKVYFLDILRKFGVDGVFYRLYFEKIIF